MSKPGSFLASAEAKQDVLLDLAVHPLVIHDEQISSGTVGLRANEQVGAPVSLSWMTLRRITSIISSYLQIRRDTRISRWQASPCVESTGCGQLASPTVEDELDGWPRCNTMHPEGNGKCDAIREQDISTLQNRTFSFCYDSPSLAPVLSCPVLSH